jgi:hypothetical protein
MREAKQSTRTNLKRSKNGWMNDTEMSDDLGRASICC